MKSVHTAAYWKDTYQMQAHPEGGYFHEIYRSTLDVNVPWDDFRSAATGIVYLLENYEVSSFHRIKSDEIWHFYDGNSPLNIHCIFPDGKYALLKLGYGNEERPCQIVPAGVWFAAELANKENTFAMVGCTVSPGFSFDDFEIADADKLSEQFPMHEGLIRQFNPID